MLHRRNDPVERRDRGHDVVVGEHHALRRAGRTGGEDQLENLVGDWRRPVGQLCLPVGREGVVRIGRECLDGRRREAPESCLPRIRRVSTGARTRCRASDAVTIPSTASADMRRSSGTMIRRARIAPKYAAGSSGVEGDQVSNLSPAWRPRARSRHAAILDRRSSSPYVQVVVDPSSRRRLRAVRWPYRVTASSRRSSRVAGTIAGYRLGASVERLTSSGPSAMLRQPLRGWTSGVVRAGGRELDADRKIQGLGR